MSDPGETWAAWLREQFDRHLTIRRAADLVRASGTKANGRPVIDASSVTQWMRGRRPRFELAQAAARAFGVPESEALAAAGYAIQASPSPEPRASHSTSGDPTRDAIANSPILSRGAREYLLAAYDREVEREREDRQRERGAG